MHKLKTETTYDHIDHTENPKKAIPRHVQIMIDTIIFKHVITDQTALIEMLIGIVGFRSINIRNSELYIELSAFGLEYRLGRGDKGLSKIREQKISALSENILLADIDEPIKKIATNELYCREEIDNDYENRINQWLLVTRGLSHNLIELKAPVLVNGFGRWWGRQDTDIVSDPLLSYIAHNGEAIE